MNNKKGIRDVVTTVLIVLLSLVAVAIVWSFLSPLILKSGTQISQTQACLSASLEVLSCTSTATSVNVTIERSAGAANISAIKVILESPVDGSTEVKPQTTNLPDELGTKVYPFTLTYKAKSASAAMGIVDAKGVTNYCTPSQPTSCT